MAPGHLYLPYDRDFGNIEKLKNAEVYLEATMPLSS